MDTTAVENQQEFDRRKKFTVDEYYRMGEVGILTPDERTELLDGEVILKDQVSVENPGEFERRKYTVAEYYRMSEAGILPPDERTELLDGVILLMDPP